MSIGDIAVYSSTDTSSITSSSSATTFGTTVREDGGFSRTGPKIAIADAGHYLVLHQTAVNASVSGTNRVVTSAYIGLGKGATPEPGSYVYTYIRNANGINDDWKSSASIIQIDQDNETLVVYAAEESSSTATISRLNSGAGLALLRLSDSFSYCRLTFSSSGPDQDFVDENWSSFIWDNEEELDLAFSHSPDTEIIINSPGRFLVTYNISFVNKAFGYLIQALHLLAELGGGRSILRGNAIELVFHIRIFKSLFCSIKEGSSDFDL